MTLCRGQDVETQEITKLVGPFADDWVLNLTTKSQRQAATTQPVTWTSLLRVTTSRPEVSAESVQSQRRPSYVRADQPPVQPALRQHEAREQIEIAYAFM